MTINNTPTPVISLIIPVYRSEGTLHNLHKRITTSLEAFEPNFEIIFIEDCGGDNSWNIIQKLASVDDRIQGIRLSRNYGQHNALLCGIRSAKGRIIVTLDDDLQNPPEEIQKLVLKLDEDFDVVYGSPKKQTHGFLRNIASRITKAALKGNMGAKIANDVSAFRVFRTRLRDAFKSYQSPNVSIDVLLTWGTTRFTSVQVKQDERVFGESGYTLRKLITHAVNMMTGFSTLPLKLASIVGFIFSIIGISVLTYVVVRYFIEGSSMPGFTFLASIIAIFSGVQLFALGVFGEYLARMHLRSMDRPTYVVHEDTHKPRQASINNI